MKPINYIWLLLLGLMGCESMIQEVPAPEEKAELVVSSILRNNTGVYWAEVSMSKPAFGPVDFSEYEKVDDATVVITDGVQSVELKLDAPGYYYIEETSKRIIPNREFKISVTRPNGMSAHSSCVTPNTNRPIVRAVLDSSVVESFLTDKRFLFEISVLDIKNSDDYYRIEGSFFLSNGEYRDISFGQRFRVFSDKDRNGETIKINGSGRYVKGATVMQVYISLTKMDRNSYLYFGSLHTAVSDLGESVPFLEPTIVPNNIENGLGVFGAQHLLNYDFDF